MNARFAIPSILALLVLAVLIPATPPVRGIPTRDSGAFLYTAWRALEGEVPYRDVWDHKPPGIFLIDAVGLAIGGGSLWGVWFLEFVSLALAAALCFRLLQGAFGRLPSFVATVLMLLSVPIVSIGGNMTEEYALAFNFGLLVLYRATADRGPRPWMSLTMGALAGAVFLLKQNLIGVAAAVCLSLAIQLARERQWRDLAAGIGLFAAGLGAVLGLCAGYFAAHGALGDLWESAFVYNFAYSSPTLYERLRAAAIGLRYLTRSGLAPLAVAGWIVAFGACVSPRSGSKIKEPLLLAALIGLPIEVYLASVSADAYEHYFYAWFPLMAVLSAFSVSWLTERFAAVSENAEAGATAGENVAARAAAGRRTILNRVLIACVLLAAVLPARQWLFLMRYSEERNRRPPSENAVVQAIERWSGDGDTVLIWGAEAGFNFITRRRAPGRFFYQYPLFDSLHPDPELAREFLADLKSAPPALIIDSSPTNPKVPPIDPAEYEEWLGAEDGPAPRIEPRPGVAEIRRYIRETYASEAPVDGWDIYLSRDRPARDDQRPPAS